MKVDSKDVEAVRRAMRYSGSDVTAFEVAILIATARQEGRREALEEAANKADDHCRHATRLCVASWEEVCSACLCARDIRALAGREER